LEKTKKVPGMSRTKKATTATAKVVPKVKFSMAVLRIFYSFSLISTTYMLSIQIRFLDNHPIDLSPPFSMISIVLRNAETEKRDGNNHADANVVLRKSKTEKKGKRDDSKNNEDAYINAFTSKKNKVNCDEIFNDDVDADVKPILKILCQGGYDVSKTSNEVDRSLLPKWSQILTAYGPPKILGLETCQVYRDKIKPEKRFVAPAGMFNSGTNVLPNLLDMNCDFSGLGSTKHTRHSAFQVPWGKHMPFSTHTNHAVGQKQVSYHHVLPVVMIRDPYTWMQSMCRQPYGAQYDHSHSSCPNIVPYPSDIQAHPRFQKTKHIPVHVSYDTRIRYKKKYESMAHLWNEWYTEYIEFDDSSSSNNNDNNNNKAVTMKTPDFPFLVVRMEDILFHADTVLPQICECLGGKINNGGQVKHFAMIANRNQGIDESGGIRSGLLRSVINYGNITKRRDGYPAFQLVAAKDTLDSKLMNLLEYRYEEP
jgi:hypothetical protein